MIDWLKNNRWVATSAALSFLAAVSFFFPAQQYTRWFGVAVLLYCIPYLVRSLKPDITLWLDGKYPNWGKIVSDITPYAIASIGTLICLGPITLGNMPISQDHANHYFFTQILVDNMLSEGRLFGWTDRLGNGYPFGDIHYTLCYFVTALPRLLSFGLVDAKTSYAIGIVIVWLASSLAVVAIARRLKAGPFSSGLAGIAMAIDVGSDREGGWTYSMFHGVWPQKLGVAMWIFSLLSLFCLAEKTTTKRLAVTSLLIGVSLWVHPMNAVTFLIAGVLLIAVRLLYRSSREADSYRGVFRLFVPLVIGALIGLLWIIRMIEGGEDMQTMAVYWEQLSQLGARAFESSLFEHTFPIVTALSIVGTVAALRLGGRFRYFAVLLPAVLVTIGSMDLVLSTDLGLVKAFRSLQYRRFSMPAKPFWYALAALGVSISARGILAGQAAERARTILHGPAFRIMAAILFAPIALGVVQAMPSLITSPSSRPLTIESAKETRNLREIGEILDKEAERLGSSRVHRAVYFEKPGHGGRYPMLAISDAGFGMLPTLFPPAQNYRRLARTTSTEAMRQAGVSVIISRWSVEHDRLEDLGKFGAHHVYRFRDLPPQSAILEGPGKAEIIAWSDENRVIKLSGVNEQTTLTLMMPPHRKWSAYLGDKETALYESSRRGVIASEIEGLRNGELRLVYKDSILENVCFVLGLALVLICVAGLFIKSRPVPFIWTEGKQLASAYRILSFGLLAACVFTLAGWSYASRAGVRSEWLSNEGSDAKVTVLHRRGATRFTSTKESFCVKPHTRDPAWGCNDFNLAPRIAPTKGRGGKIPSCLSVGIPPKGSSQVEFALPSDASVVKGRLHIARGSYKHGGGAISGEILFDPDESTSTPIGEANRSGKGFNTEVPQSASTIVFNLKNKKNKPLRACIEAVAISSTAR
ncbi:MAG: hypothetical protein GY854_15420 [Deltaproteobacteria bacterium]|nr:hypothetical protein [Deltaproteobacteria bacterium]